MKDHGTQGRIFWGLLLIILGVLFLLDQLGKLEFGDLVGRFWPVIFILLGLSILFSNNFRNAGPGLFFILFGAVFLLIRLGVLDHAFWHYAWPLAIVGAGVWLLIRPSGGGSDAGDKKGPEPRPAVTGTTGDSLDIKQIFSGTSRRVDSQDFKGGVVEVVFGSAEIDLRGVRLSGGEATLALSVLFGSIEIMVPHEWQVVVDGSPILGSIESKKTTIPDAGKTGTLRVKASALFGSVEVKE